MPDDTPKKKRGGARPGAGRKPGKRSGPRIADADRRTTLAVCLPRKLIDRLRGEARRENLSLSRYVSRLLDRE